MLAAGRSVTPRAARELLAIQSSDWAFMVTKDSAADYARRRIREHAHRAHALLDALDAGDDAHADLLADQVTAQDWCFGHLDARLLSEQPA